MNKCFYSVDHVKTIGPVTIEDLKELHRAAKISDFTICSLEAPYSSWSSAFSIAGCSNRNGAFDNPSSNQSGILSRYLGAIISANVTDPLKVEATQLAFVGTDYFSLRPIASRKPIHYPNSAILSLREWPAILPYSVHRPVDLTLKQGTLSKFFNGKAEERKPEFIKVELTTPLTIELYHNVIYRNGGGVGWGIGVAVPIG